MVSEEGCGRLLVQAELEREEQGNGAWPRTLSKAHSGV